MHTSLVVCGPGAQVHIHYEARYAKEWNTEALLTGELAGSSRDAAGEGPPLVPNWVGPAHGALVC